MLRDYALTDDAFLAAVVAAPERPQREKVSPSGLRRWPATTHDRFVRNHPWRRPIVIMGEFAPLRFRVGDRIRWGDQMLYVSGVNRRCIRVWVCPVR